MNFTITVVNQYLNQLATTLFRFNEEVLDHDGLRVLARDRA